MIQILPFLKWAGGKRWLLSIIDDLLPSGYNDYIEPFLGSGAVFFHLRPKNAILNDINTDLINTYIQIRDNYDELENFLMEHQFSHSDEYYYKIRGIIPNCKIQRASNFIYLNRTCFNGLYRVNKNGVFNVPKGSKDKVLLESDKFSEISTLLKNTTLKNIDFEKVIDDANEGDFVFIDPPYTVNHNNNGFIKYNEMLFSWDDQLRLSNSIISASQRGVSFIMTNADHESIRSLYNDHFETHSLTRNSVMASKSNFRGKTTELLVKNI
ncbi:MAG: Dam family site-specific DNA-(adenine-N6)-methyltransferase [Candidatus Paceibacterota bacterium]